MTGDLPEGQRSLYDESGDELLKPPPAPDFKTVVVHEHTRKVRIRKRNQVERPATERPDPTQGA